MDWRHKKVFHTTPLPASMWPELNKAQEKVEGYNFDDYKNARIAIIGAGALGCHTASALIRQGPGEIILIDDDHVEASNLTRQLFAADEIGKNKAICLARRLSREGFFPTKITAWPFRFMELVERGDMVRPDIVLACVDNNSTRRAACLFGLAHAIRGVVHVAVGRDGNAISVMVQEPGKACWACAYPDSLNDHSHPCGLPGIVDVSQVAAGVAVFAIGSLLSGRHREWTTRLIYLDAGAPDQGEIIERRPDCALCGPGATAARASEPVPQPSWWSRRSA